VDSLGDGDRRMDEPHEADRRMSLRPIDGPEMRATLGRPSEDRRSQALRDYDVATEDARTALLAHGMNSPEFAAAIKKTDELRRLSRNPVAMSGKLRTSFGRQDVALSDLTAMGCRIDAIYMILTVGQRIILRPEGLEGLNATVSWSSGPSAGLKFDTLLHPSVVDHLCKLHPQVIAVDIVT
jgi:hypothetical protein